ncbi:MAG: serine hydrolase domain-containing protein [Clostridia bacterium]|nr:serine hydrolase domain-containing protein [Clostridia bacterium]
MKVFKKFIVLILLSSLLFLNLSSISYGMEQSKKFPSGLSYEELPSAIENYVAKNSKTMAGMNVALYDRNGLIYQNNFGFANKEDGIKSDKNTVYEWGSTSKLFIWISAMQLAEQGKLDLQKDIKNYLPENFLKNLKYDKPITMLNLMNHQAGFQDTYFIQTSSEDEMVSLDKALSRNQPKQIYEPGTVTAYSNWGASLAAYIIQIISGMDYVNYVHKNIFEPLSMKNTSIGATYQDNTKVKEKRNELVCYDANGNKISGKGLYYIFLYPAGSAAGTIDDLLTFAKAITPDANKPCPLFEKKETLDKLYTVTSYYGDSGVGNNYHGFFANQYRINTLGHGGNTFGCSTMLQFDPISGIGMVVMTNQAHEKIYNYDMYELIFGKFSESKLAKIKREIPDGLVINARGIMEGPLSILGAIGILSYGEEDLSSWWYADDNYVYGGYSDYIISTPKAIINIAVCLLFIIAGIYAIITVIFGGLILSPIQKSRNKRNKIEVNQPFKKWNYAMNAVMGLIFANIVTVFMRINRGNITGEIGKIETYMVQSGITGILALMLIIGILYILFVKIQNKKPISKSKREKTKYISTTVFGICMLIAVFMFDMYKFWAI